eukprot:COSAG06_NODE_685_length_13103_cov_126.328668_12_plen_67_part_00
MSARNPIKCPICAKSNKVSSLRKLSREDLAKFRAIFRAIGERFARRSGDSFARRSGEISRAKIWRR